MRNALKTARFSQAVGWGLFGLVVLVAILNLALDVSGCLPAQLSFSVENAYASLLLRYLTIIAPAVAFSLMGALIITNQPNNRIGWLATLFGLVFTSSFFTLYYGVCSERALVNLPGGLTILWLGSPLAWLWLTFLLLMLIIFPDGRFQSSRWKWLALSLIGLGGMFTFLSLFAPGYMLSDFPEFAGEFQNPYALAIAPAFPWVTIAKQGRLFTGLAFALVAVPAPFLRWRRAQGVERQQIKWLAFFLIIAGTLFIGFEFVGTNFYPPIFDSLFYPMVLSLFFLGLPAVLGISILKYRLYDIDIIINRTLVYGGLTFGIIATYILVVGAMGVLFHSQGNYLPALIATGISAILFQPLRDQLQQRVNRLMFGERDDPYAVLSKFSAHLQTISSPEETLQSTVETIAETLKLPYVAIELVDEQGPLGGATIGKPLGDQLELPLRSHNEAVGRLAVSPRSPGEQLNEREQRLLADIAAQMGPLARSVLLTAALQRSREKLVLSREAERRRIRRDLHDGLGPTLASQTFTMDAILRRLETDPQEAADLLHNLKAQNKELVADIRRLVYELRPPVLDELGLLDALRANVAQFSMSQTLQLTVTAHPDPLPALSAAVEVAAYRIVLEAITNVVRHAEARQCQVNLAISEDGRSHLLVEVRDDGQGVPAEMQAGVGLRSIRERAEELGGSLTIRNLSHGTMVRARLPLALMTSFSATTSGSVHLRQASASDYPAVMEIIADAAAWLTERGIDQWPSPPNEHWQRRTLEQVERSEFYLVYEGEQPVGTFRLTWHDAYWLDDGLAGYVHRLAICRHKHRQGLGDVMLELAIGLVRQEGRRVVRLDVSAENGRLRQYYERRGFTYRGQVEDHDYLGALFEKEI